jgi:hypothetical protein
MRDMGRPIGSLNRQKPFADALRLEICAGSDPRRLRAIARKLIEMAEGALHLVFVIGGGGGVHAYASLPPGNNVSGLGRDFGNSLLGVIERLVRAGGVVDR